MSAMSAPPPETLTDPELAAAWDLASGPRLHCGNNCPLGEAEWDDIECPQQHWCDSCGDCLGCYGYHPHD